MHLPAASLRRGPLPGVVHYQGYNGGRGLVHEHVFWATAGYAHLVVDTRGQGSGFTTGATGDPEGAGPAQPGFLTRGLDDPDATSTAGRTPTPSAPSTCCGCTRWSTPRAWWWPAPARAARWPSPRPRSPRARSRRCCATCPSSATSTGRWSIAQAEPYLELVRYLAAHRDMVERAFATLSYVDGAVLARLASAPALFSVALMDRTCPPSTVFAAYHAYGGPAEIAVYEYNDHEGGEAFQRSRQLAWLAETLGDPREAAQA